MQGNVVELPGAQPSTDLQTVSTGTAALILDGQSLDRMMKLAEIMATGKVTLPAEYRNNSGDCLAVVMQAMQWKMNPYAVAQKTHFISGKIGYEAQLVHAAILMSGFITKDGFEYEWYGPWEKVVGQFEIRKGDKGEYRVPGWKLADEAGIGIRIRATIAATGTTRELDLLLAQARTRNSTLWADDPRQQLAYLAEKRWGRLYCPHVILGVYTPDELAEIPPGERDMGTVDVVPEAKPDIASRVRQATGHEPTPPAAEKAPTLDAVLREIKAAKSSEDLAKAAEKCAKLVNDDDKATARAEYKTKFDALKAAAAGPTFAEIEAQIQAAESVAAVNAAQDLIRSIKDDSQREELGELAAKKIDALTPV